MLHTFFHLRPNLVLSRILLLYLLLGIAWVAPAQRYANLYEQLCDINQEWKKYASEAQKRGFLSQPAFAQEQDILSFHIQTLADIFAQQPTEGLSIAQIKQRERHIQHLRNYANLRNCPRNYYLPYRNPVFIDAQNRYCAVAYLMLQDGKKAFCEAVQKINNFIFIKQIQAPEFHEWQAESGLSLDELAWIQPAYDPLVSFVHYNQFKNNKPVKVNPQISKRWYNPNNDTTVFMASVFFGAGIPYEYQFKKMNYKGKKPAWHKMQDRITAIQVFKDEVYIATDSVRYEYLPNKDEIICHDRSAIWKYNAQTEEWEQILDLKGKERVYKLKLLNGKLLAYGGSVKHNYSETNPKPPTYKSFLASFDGNKWEFDENDYQAIIFMVIAKSGKIQYLGTVTNGIDFMDINGNIDAPK